MDISKFLSKVIGIYLIIVSLAMLVNMPQFIKSVHNLIHDEPSMCVAGFVTCILGVLMVVSHNIWQWNWRMVITLFSWLVLLKGISIIFYPQFIGNTAILFMHNTHVTYSAAIIDLALGLLLCYFSYHHCSSNK